MLGVFLALFSAVNGDLQLVRVAESTGNQFFSLGLGLDFTVTSAIDVTALGIVDTGPRGFNGTLSARVLRRSDGAVVIGPMTVSASDAGRVDDANPFAFRNLTPSVRLEAGAYCLVSIGFNNDQFVNQGLPGGTLMVTDSSALVVTAGVYGGDGTVVPTVFDVQKQFYAAATFLFDVVQPPAAPMLPLPEYVDCEQVACTGLRTGEYNVLGKLRYCDNDMAGGGWMRLWRANETSCEANGWSSARNPSATGSDPFGCRSASPACVEARSTRAPFRFNEVRGGNWGIWVFGGPDGFNVPQLCDGIIVRDGNNNLVWLLAVGMLQTTYPELHCPCEASFRNTSLTSMSFNASGPHWTCDRAPLVTFAWTKLFHDKSTLICNAIPSAAIDDVLWFQRTLTAPQTVMSVSICLNEPYSNEDLKLSSGDLFVRATIGFEKSKNCPTTTTTATTTGSTIGATVTTSSNLTASVVPSAPPNDNVALIAGVVGGSVVAVLIGLAIYFLRRRQNRVNNRANGDVAMNPANSSNYGIVPNLAGAAPSSHYSQHAADFKARLPISSNYSQLTPAEASLATRDLDASPAAQY
jgi:hypothetical protein